MKSSNISIQTKKELIDLLHSKESVIKEFGVQRLGLFGSFVRDEVNKDSDIDFLVELPSEKKTLKNFMGLIYYLEDITGRKVEVLTPQGLSPFIGPHILKEVENVFS